MSSSGDTTKIRWPTLVKPVKPLVLKELYPGILIISNLFSPASLKVWNQFLTSPTTPIILTSSPAAKRGKAHRTNYRFGIQDKQFAEDFWNHSGLKDVCAKGGLEGKRDREAVGLNSNIRVYRYSSEQFFGPHYDDDFFDPETKQRSEWTLLIYLTGVEDGVAGGSTVFYPPELAGNRKNRTANGIVAPLERGSALLHRHGSECVLHEGQKVEKGIKWVLRTDVMFK